MKTYIIYNCLICFVILLNGMLDTLSKRFHYVLKLKCPGNWELCFAVMKPAWRFNPAMQILTYYHYSFL